MSSDPASDQVPDAYEQALEAARDDPSRRELANMVYDLPDVLHVDVDGEDEEWRPTAIVVDFEDEHGRGVVHVLRIMRRGGWKPVDVTFSRERVTFEERDGDG